MNQSELGQRQHKAMTEYGMAVEQSGFGRVCPKCYHKWALEMVWVRETEFVGQMQTTGGMVNVRQHPCGGEMLTTGRASSGGPLRSSARLAQASYNI